MDILIIFMCLSLYLISRYNKNKERPHKSHKDYMKAVKEAKKLIKRYNKAKDKYD